MQESEISELYNNNLDYYAGSRPEMQDFLPKNSKKVLDIGCGQGSFSSALKDKFSCECWGIDISKTAIEIASQNLDKTFCGPIAQTLNDLPDHYFDAIYFNDVLEHLVNPDKTILSLKNKLSLDRGVIIASIPNVRFFRNLHHILFDKDWKYQDEGILDRTHLRFFTKKSMIRLFEDNGFEILKIEGINKTRSFRPYFYNFLTFGNYGLDTLHVQYAVVAKPIKRSS